MVSSSHEAMHRIFQEDPGIFARTFAALGIPFPEPIAVSLLPTDLTEIQPLERRVDSLLQIDTASGVSYLLAVEAQGKRDPDKPGNWAYYLAHLYAKYRLAPVLLVTCQDRATARWAAEPVIIGVAGWETLTVRPLVLGPHNVPAITDPAVAAADIPLATFSVITHGRDPNAAAILKALATALKTIDEDTAQIFAELTELGLGTAPAADLWRDLMTVDLDFFRSQTSQRIREEGREQGREEGRAEAQAAAIFEVLTLRGIKVSDRGRRRIADCSEFDLLHQWFRRSLTATTEDDVFSDGDEHSGRL
ncbi:MULTISPECIES: hypothetical protein [Streptacidiphilus]|uniref:Rpn family recombination-promoting nuclease/putative transposase n=1 Tax=Streptacidiphilus cavernicola TaxID=3342716 RepID=A0ABV6ULP9_9ACTN|nr:hypothetical protein [Streptacidiphilus jeojiense]